jgi:hypothetical protein
MAKAFARGAFLWLDCRRTLGEATTGSLPANDMNALDVGLIIWKSSGQATNAEMNISNLAIKRKFHRGYSTALWTNWVEAKVEVEQ